MEFLQNFIRKIIVEPENRQPLKFHLRMCQMEDFADIVNMQDYVLSALGSKSLFARTDENSIAESLELDACFGVYCNYVPAAFTIMVTNRNSNRNLGTYLDYDTERLGKCVTFDSTFVMPEYRGYGIQSLLMRVKEDAAVSLGATEALATVSPDNEVSHGNLIKNGFTVVADRIMYTGVRRYILHKYLQDSFSRKGAFNGPGDVS